MPEPLTDDERERIVALARAGHPRNHVAREVGRSPGVVSKVCKAAGVSFDREAVKSATEARQADNQAKRAQLQSDLLDDAIRLREQLWEPCVVYNFGGRDNTYEQHTLDQPDAAGKATLLRAVGIAVDKSVRLAEVDRAGAGAAEGRGILGRLSDALGAAYDQLGDGESDDQGTEGPEVDGEPGEG